MPSLKTDSAHSVAAVKLCLLIIRFAVFGPTDTRKRKLAFGSKLGETCGFQRGRFRVNKWGRWSSGEKTSSMDEYSYPMDEAGLCLHSRKEKRLQRMVHILIVAVLVQFLTTVILLVALGLHGQEPQHSQVGWYLWMTYISVADSKQKQQQKHYCCEITPAYPTCILVHNCATSTPLNVPLNLMFKFTKYVQVHFRLQCLFELANTWISMVYGPFRRVL